ncbi:DUF4139 domain-containing protein [Pirellulaceae bacterium SH449]
MSDWKTTSLTRLPAMFFAVCILGHHDAIGQLDADTEASTLLPATYAAMTDVMLFPRMALITKEIDVPVEPDTQVLHFGTLPEQVILSTVHATASDGLDLDSVLTQEKDPTERETLRQTLRAEQSQLLVEKEALHVQVSVMEKQLLFLDRTLDYGRLQGASDLHRGSLDTKALTGILDYGLNKQVSLSNEKEKAVQRLREVDESITRLAKKIQAEQQRNSERYELQVRVRNNTASDGKVRISYFVGGCYWEPNYILHYDSQKNSFRLQVTPKIIQNSGEDWKDVTLRLSSQNAQSFNESPTLIPLQVRTYRTATDPNDFPFATESKTAGKSKGTVQELVDQNAKIDLELAEELKESWSLDYFGQSNLERNQRAILLQEAELKNSPQRMALLASDASEPLGEFSLIVARPISLNSRDSAQTIEAASRELNGSISHVAAPLLSSFAYREASFAEGTDLSLLDGKVLVYQDQQFVGHTSLRSTPSGQPFFIGLGADANVRTRRELIGKSREMQGGNTREEHSIKVVVANYYNHSIKLRLLERMPLPVEQREATAEYSPSSPELSSDPLYRRTLFPRNVLRWDLEIPESCFGAKAFDHKYSYSLVYDKSAELNIAFQEVVTDINKLEEIMYSLDTMSMGGGMGGMGGGMGGMMNADTDPKSSKARDAQKLQRRLGTDAFPE